ncbi:MAG TPA: GAF domain-containing protein [Anaerolineae bacterium]|nr:GAF domain-containing protein [Anaerolineae bacterium]
MSENKPQTAVTLFENKLPSAVALLDTRLYLVEHNNSWLRYIDSDAGSVTGKHLFEVLPEAKQVLQPLVAQALEGESAEKRSLSLTVHDSDVYWDVSLQPQSDQRGNVTAVLLVAYAITEEAMLRKLLEQRIDDRHRKLEALYAIAKIATEAKDLDQALSVTLQRVAAATQATAATIHQFDPETKQLKLRSHLGLQPELIERMGIVSAENDWADWSITSDKALVLADARGDTRTPVANNDNNLVSYAAIPLRRKGQIFGLLTVFRDKKNAFSEADVDLLTSVADQVCGIIQMFRLQSENATLLLQEERSRLATQLHDAVTQSLYSLTLFTGAIQQYAKNGEIEKGLAYIDRLQSTAQQALKEMRLLLHNLRPMALATDGLVEALRQRLNAVEGRAGIQGKLITETEIDLPAKIEEELFYIANEALNNALKHANAQHVTIVLHQTDTSIHLLIRDDGKGFDLEKAQQAGGMGLTTLRERTRKLGGTITFETSAEHGTKIAVSLPLTTKP